MIPNGTSLQLLHVRENTDCSAFYNNVCTSSFLGSISDWHKLCCNAWTDRYTVPHEQIEHQLCHEIKLHNI